MRRWLLIGALLVLAFGLGASARQKQRFYMRDVSAIGNTQSAYIVEDTATGRCVLVVQFVYSYSGGMASQPWPCK